MLKPSSRLYTAWLVCLTLLANLYLVPALGQRTGSDALFLGTICSVNPAHASRAPAGETGFPESSQQATHCALCASQAGDQPALLSLPQSPPALTGSETFKTARAPEAGVRPPRLLPDSRAPPLA